MDEDEEKTFFSEIVPDICDESLTKEGCRMSFERNLSGSRYLDSSKREWLGWRVDGENVEKSPRIS